MTDRAEAAHKVNQADIARRAGVSISTVSRALSGTAGLRPELRKRILAIAETLGYATAERPGGQRVVVILPMHPATGGLHQVFQETFDGIRAAATAEGYELFPYLLAESDVTLARMREIHSARGTTCTIILYCRIAEDLRDYMVRTGPLIIVHEFDTAMQFDTLVVDGRNGTRMLTERVLAMGHRRLCFLMGHHRRNATERLLGFEEALRGCPGAQGEVIALGHDRQETAYDHFTRTFRSGLRPECSVLLCVNDLMALGVLQAVQEAGLSVPGDFSVAGFDNLGWSQIATPQLATMNVDRGAMGRETIELLGRRLRAPQAPVLAVSQGCTFLPGQSLAPPPNVGPTLSVAHDAAEPSRA